MVRPPCGWAFVHMLVHCLLEYGPVRYEVRDSRFGITPKAELINGRIAMAAITAASIYSYFDGSLLDTVIKGELPEAFRTLPF